MDATIDKIVFWCCDCPGTAHPHSVRSCAHCKITRGKKRPNFLDYCERPASQALEKFLSVLPINDCLFNLLPLCGVKRPGGAWGGQVVRLLVNYVNSTHRLPAARVTIAQHAYDVGYGSDDFARGRGHIDRGNTGAHTGAHDSGAHIRPAIGEEEAARLLTGLALKRRAHDDPDSEDRKPKRTRADELLLCMRCQREFDFVSRLPELVHACGHTFCGACLFAQNKPTECWTCRAAWPEPLVTTTNQGVQDAILLRRRNAEQPLSVHALVHVSDASVEKSFMKTRIQLASMRASAGLDIPALRALDAAFLAAQTEEQTEELRAWCLYVALDILTKLGDDLPNITKLVRCLEETEQAQAPSHAPLYQSLILLAELQAPKGFESQINAELEVLVQSVNKTVKSRAHLGRGLARSRRGQTALALEDFQIANDLGSDVAAWYALQLHNVCRLQTPLSLWAHWGLLYERLRRLSPSGYTYGWASVLLAKACWRMGSTDAARQLAQRAWTVEGEQERVRARVVFQSSELKDVKLRTPFWLVSAAYILRAMTDPKDPNHPPSELPDVFRDHPREWINFCQQVGLQIN